MFGTVARGKLHRRILNLAAIVGVIVAVAGLGGCGALLVPRAAPTATPIAAPAALTSPQVTSTPLPLAPIITPTPTDIPATPAEAQAVVAAWFDAVIAQDFQGASDLTLGSASNQTKQLSESFARATGTNSVRLVTQSLGFSPGPAQSDSSRAVIANFDIQVNAQMGPVTVTVQHLVGSATFFVGRVGGRTVITDIRDVIGLPIAQ